MSKRRGRGEGSLEELPSGKWRAVLSAGSQGGKRLKLTHTAETKREAQAWLRARQAEASRGAPSHAGKTTLGEWLTEWLAARSAKVEPATARWYRKRVELHLIPAGGHLLLGKITPRDVEKLHAELTARGVPPGEQRRCATTLRAALGDAVKYGLISDNPAKKVRKPKATRQEARPMDAEQARAFLAAARTDRLAAMWDFWLDAGPRPGEVYGLHWPDLNLEAGTVFIHQSLSEVDGVLKLKQTKTRKGRRVVPLAPRTVAALAAHRERMRAEGRDVAHGPVFVSARGALLRQSHVACRSFRKIARRAGIKSLRPYDLRHTSATLLLASGVNVKVVSERLGHERIETTLRHYAHCLPTMQNAATQAISQLYGDCPTVVTPEGRKPGRPRKQAGNSNGVAAGA